MCEIYKCFVCVCLFVCMHVHVCLFVCMHVCLFVCMHVHVHLFVCMHVHLFACVYVRMIQIMFGVSIMVLLLIPTKIVSYILPTFLPYNLTLMR